MKSILSTSIFLLFVSLLGAEEIKPGAMSATIAWHDFSTHSDFTYLEKKSAALEFNRAPHHAGRLTITLRQLPFTSRESYYIPMLEEKFYLHAGFEYIRTLRIADKVHFRIGGGPAAHISLKEDKKNHKKLLDQYTFGPALSVGCGLDYFVFKNMAIRAEYATFVQFGMDVFGEYGPDPYGEYSWPLFYSLHTAFIDSFTQIGFTFYF